MVSQLTVIDAAFLSRSPGGGGGGGGGGTGRGVTRKIHEDRDEEERKKDERGKNKASGETDARLCARLSSQC